MSTTTTTGIAAQLARPNILELQPYRCARDDYSEGILLDANENAFGPPLSLDQALERYPDPYQIPLKEKFAAYRGQGLRPENIFVGVGSDEAIDLLMRIFCIPGKDQILITPPTYGMYKVSAKVNDVAIVSVPLTPDFDIQVPEIIQAITPTVKMIFLCSPGNPTAKLLALQDIEAVVQRAPQCLVVVDEAYIDFATTNTGETGGGSAVKLLQRYPNVVILQTLSKAFGLAAIRCGFCFAAPDVIQLLNNVKAPYNMNALTSATALQALEEIPVLQDKVRTILEQRDRVRKALEMLDFVIKVYPSDANFILFRVKQNAERVYKQMADGGVVTRYRGTELHCTECIRVTVGTPSENDAFLEALERTYRALKESA